MRVVKEALHRRSVRWALVIVVTLVLVFEVTVRHLPPDGVTIIVTEHYVVSQGFDGSTVASDATVVTGRRTTSTENARARAQIAALVNALNTASLSEPLEPNCATLGGWQDYQVVFTWHGLPVQVWTSAGGCPTFRESSGGLPNLLWTRTLSAAGDQALLALA